MLTVLLSLVGAAGVLKFILGIKDKSGKPWIKNIPATLQPYAGTVMCWFVVIIYNLINGTIHGQDVVSSLSKVFNDPTQSLGATALGGLTSQFHNLLQIFQAVENSGTPPTPPAPVVIDPHIS